MIALVSDDDDGRDESRFSFSGVIWDGEITFMTAVALLFAPEFV